MLPRFAALIVLTHMVFLSMAVAGESKKGDAEAAPRLLTNPTKDMTVFSDREEKLADFFQRQRIVIAGAAPKELTAQFEAREAGPEVFVSYASYNFGPGGARSTFGAFIRIAPISRAAA